MAIKDSFVGSAPYTDYHINFTTVWARGQWFVASSSYDVTSVDISVKKYNAGSTPGTVTVAICTVDEDNLPDTVLDSSTFNGDALYTGYIWQSVNLSVSLVSGTKYCITVIPAATGLVWAGDNAPAYTGSTQWYNDVIWDTFADGVDQRFRVNGISLPSAPINPTPEHKESGISLSSTTVTWEDGGGADAYNIYYGTLSGFLTLVAEGVTDLEIVLIAGNFDHYGEVYYWRVDAVNDAGTTQGDEWYFTALIFDPVLPTGTSLDEDGEPTGDPTGENNMITIKRLVAAAKNAIWYEEI